MTFRVRTDVLAALEKAGIAPADVARAALEREADRARKLATLKRLRDAPSGLKLGVDAVSLLRKDRETRHG
ncbi:MAG TPA: hypothetical protein VHH36_05100 [Candidatus Thermoplasmatota archaeon]|nr:hypothetical protein [Candidatus Thermoplasmatota archaeon]